MNELLTKYERFFKLLRRDQEKKYEDYAKTALSQLFAESKAYYGYITGITSRGEMILKFENGYAPRLKVPMEFCVLRKRAFAVLGDNIAQWSWNSLKFRENADLHTSFSSVLPIFYLDDRKSAGCGQIDYEMVRQLKPHIENKEKLQFVMLETMPPTEMLMHLAGYINSHSSDNNLMLQPFRSYDEWKPKELKNTDNVSQQVIDILEKDKICVLQGPPGTGKSYTLGEIISKITEKGESVCVTTQSNDSLTSLVAQETLEPLINREGHISKTVLTSEEKKKYPFLSAADRNLLIPKGGLLLSTYYSLSRIINKSEEPHFDLIVIEEASQAYLTAIAAFIKLGKKCLIVGDPMQLPPVVEIVSHNDYVGIDIDTQANGMMTFIRSTNVPSIRMTTSCRLTSASTEQAKVFYNNNFTSVRTENLDFQPTSELSAFFPLSGGTIVYNTSGSTGGDCSKEALEIMRRIERFFIEKHPKRKLAILSPYVRTTQILQKEFCGDNQKLDIKVETINRIQGMTVDYTIFYIPQRNYDFAFSENLFNVATSRSKSTTLIITDMPISLVPIKSNKVREFLSHCIIISQSQTSLINSENTKCLIKEDSIQDERKSEDSKSQITGLKVVGYMPPLSFQRKMVEIKPDKTNIYIIDTNVFVNCPDIISKIDKQYQVTLSAKVVDELDKLKVTLNPDGQKAVQDAIRNINRCYETRNLTMEIADISLLPADFNPKSPDNQILSVALKLKNDKTNPIILTSDNGLQLKSKGLGITTISLKDFLKKPK